LPPAYPSATQPHSAPRSLHFALVVTGSLWFVAALTISQRAAQGIADRFNLASLEGLLEEVFLLFLLLLGFTLIYGVTRQGVTRQGVTSQGVTGQHAGMRAANALPKRSTTGQEVLRGVALGWAMLLVAVLPMMLTGSLHLLFSHALGDWELTLISLVTVAVSTLAIEVGFRGFLFARLIGAFGPSGATIVLSLLYAFVSLYRPNASALSFLVTFLTGVLFSLAYLRTHALWFGWGLHFGWDASMALLLGLPVAGYTTWSNLINTTALGPNWLTGGGYGPEGALFTVLVVCGAIFVLYRLTRDYAWNYTHAPIVPAGYEVVVAPPAAHTAMEAAAAAAPAPLVQILGSTSTASSTMPIIDEHLRRESAGATDE
jgi:membrane protease YdiL (CAAX protease family)